MGKGSEHATQNCNSGNYPMMVYSSGSLGSSHLPEDPVKESGPEAHRCKRPSVTTWEMCVSVDTNFSEQEGTGTLEVLGCATPGQPRSSHPS